MPIILDQNSTDNAQKQMKQVNKQLKTATNVRSTWFHPQLTGSETRKDGFFNKDNHTINHVTENAMNKVGHTSELENILPDMMHRGIIRPYTETEHKKSYFTPYARVLTSLALPSLFANYTPYDYRKIQSNDIVPDNALKLSQLSIEFPQNSPLFNTMNMNKWTELTNTNGVRTLVYPIVQSYHLFSANIKSASHTGRNKFIRTGEPIIYLAVASVTDNVNKDANIHIGLDNQEPTDDIIPMSLIPVEMTTSERYMMTNYVGPRWANIMRNIENHYTRSKLDDLDVGVHGPIHVDNQNLDIIDIVGGLSVVDSLNSQANITVNQFEEIIESTIDAFLEYHDSAIGTTYEDNVNKHVVLALKLTVQTMDHLSHKDETLVSTDFLNSIYQKLKTSKLNNSDTNAVVQESLRLLLSQRLHELQVVQKSGGLYEFDPQDDAVTQKYMNDPMYSNQQRKIVTSTEPLVIGQAGAGSGKSHTLIGRIKYLKEQDEDLSKALVLSFTNIAAININQRFPEIRSETLANMFNQIYQNTYPLQKLSQPSTVANSLTLLNPNTKYFANKGFKADEVDAYIKEFSMKLSQLDQTGFKRVNIQEITKDLANLIQHNIKLTETLLDAVEQTTLELQPIIIHHHLMGNHGHLNVPQEYQDLDYIITDESQDISTFEYILLLELAIHHSAQLMIVGDGSQTLYEFRNSDPKYMNALESSGVFTTYKLDVNFRSSPEVLTFANQFLDIIEANDVAKIQLRASSFTKPSKKSFEEAITIHNTESASSKPLDYHEALRRVVDKDKNFHSWLKDILDKGEQIAILGWTRKEVLEVGEGLEDWLDDNGYDIDITNIMSERNRPMTVISTTLAALNRQLVTMDVTKSNFEDKVLKEASLFIESKYRYSSDSQKKFFLGEFRRALQSVTNSHQWTIFVADVNNNKVNNRSVIAHLTREMLRIETRKNAMDAHLLRAEEAPDYSNEKIILSTIHGAKGLEFDHTIVLFNESKRGATSQESLRMLFVALSRAKKTEYIINGHTSRSHGVSDTLSAMFTTPMQTGFMRAVAEIEQP